MAECSKMVREINACLEEELEEGDKRTSQTLQYEKGNAIAACCLEGVRLFDNTGYLLLRN
jgi:hypothetical protein